MPKIFISYRREDSQWPARTLRDALLPHVPRGDVFMDIDNIPLGVNFADHIDKQVAQCDLVLALIGPKWLTAADASGQPRLNDPSDFVRLEIGHALKRGIPVVPVLLDDARMPSPRELPEDLRDLSMRNATQVRHATFNADAERLIEGLNLHTHKGHSGAKIAGGTIKAAPAKQGAGWVAPLVVLVLLAGGAGAYIGLGDPLHLLSPAAPTPPDAVTEVAAASTEQPSGSAPLEPAAAPATPAAATPAVTAPATAAPAKTGWTIPAGVNGPNLRVVTFNGGKARIAQTGDKQWSEYTAEGGGKEVAKWSETQRDDWSVYLSDDGRQMKMQLDVYRGWIRLAQGGGDMADWQKIDTASKE